MQCLDCKQFIFFKRRCYLCRRSKRKEWERNADEKQLVRYYTFGYRQEVLQRLRDCGQLGNLKARLSTIRGKLVLLPKDWKYPIIKEDEK